MLLDGSESGMVRFKGGKCDMRWFTLGEELSGDLSRNDYTKPILIQPCE